MLSISTITGIELRFSFSFLVFSFSYSLLSIVFNHDETTSGTIVLHLVNFFNSKVSLSISDYSLLDPIKVTFISNLPVLMEALHLLTLIFLLEYDMNLGKLATLIDFTAVDV